MEIIQMPGPQEAAEQLGFLHIRKGSFRLFPFLVPWHSTRFPLAQI